MARVYLRALEPDDYKTSVRWRNDDEINSMIGGPKYFVSSEYEKRWVENKIQNAGSEIALAVCLKANDKYIGNVYLKEINWVNRSGHCAVLVGDKDEWRRGFATEALMLILKFAFHERGLERISAEVLESNAASRGMFEKFGFVREGLLRHSVYKNGRFQNQHLLSVLRSEFDEIAKKHDFS